MSKQIFLGRSRNDFSTTTSYFPVTGSWGWTTTNYRSYIIVAAAGTLQNFKVDLISAPGVGKSVTFTLQINGVDSAITCTVSDTNTTAQDIVNTATIAEGDFINIKAVGSGTPTVSQTQHSIEFESDVSGESFHGSCTGNTVLSTTRFSSLFYGTFNTTGWSLTANAYPSIAAISGTITKVYARLSGTIVSGNYNFIVYKNGNAQDGSFGSVNTEFNITSQTGSSSFSLSVSPGDRLEIRVSPGSPSTSRDVQIGVNFIADVPGYFHLGANTQNSNTAGFLVPTNYSNADATEGNCQAKVGISPIYLSHARFWVSGSGAGGTDSYGLTLRVNGVDTALTATMPGATTTGSATANITLSPDDLISVEKVVGGTPATPRFLAFGFAANTSPPGGAGSRILMME